MCTAVFKEHLSTTVKLDGDDLGLNLLKQLRQWRNFNI